MRWLSSTLCLLVAACAQAQRADLAIRGATVVDVTDGPLASGQTVLVEGHRIVAVGPADAVGVPDEADVVEAAGGFLIPGLWDAHVHAVDPASEGTAEPSITTQDRYFPLFLAHGVTGVRNMNDHTGDVTLELTNSVRRRLAEGATFRAHPGSSPPALRSTTTLLSAPTRSSSARRRRLATSWTRWPTPVRTS